MPFTHSIVRLSLTFGRPRATFGALEAQVKKTAALEHGMALIFSASLGGQTMFIDKETQDGVREYLLGKNGEAQKLRIDRGVQQAAAFWRAGDGGAEEFVKFCKLNFIADPDRLQTLFKRIETNFEVLYGHLNKISLDLKRPLQLDWGEILPIDQRFGQFDPAAHVCDDMFDSKIAFEILLNFPTYSLAEKTALGPGVEPARLGLRPLRRPVPLPPAGPRQPERRRRPERSRDLHFRIQHLHGAPGRRPGKSALSRRPETDQPLGAARPAQGPLRRQERAAPARK